MKIIILASVVVLAITGCMTTNPQHAGDPDYTPNGWAKRPYEYIFKTDGSPKAKECVFECKKQETPCKQLAATKFQTTQMQFRDSTIIDHPGQSTKDWEDIVCEKSTIECVENICNGSVAEKHYLW